MIGDPTIEIFRDALVLRLLVGLAAACTCVVFLCRLRLLSLHRHRLPVVVLHMAGALSTGWTALQAVAWAYVDATNLAALVFAGCWIVVSLPTWRRGPPETSMRRRQPK